MLLNSYKDSCRRSGGIRAAAVSILHALHIRVMAVDHFRWARVCVRLLLLILMLCAVRHIAWARASREVLHARSPVSNSWEVSRSEIQGVGLHVTSPVTAGTSLGPCITWSRHLVAKIETLGLHVNHAWNPTAILAYRPSATPGEAGSSTLELVLLRDLRNGEEVTSNYLVSPAFIALPNPWWSVPCLAAPCRIRRPLFQPGTD